MLDLNTLPILATPPKVEPEIEGMPYPAYVGIGRRYEAGIKSLTDRAELDLEFDNAEWVKAPEDWIGDDQILQLRIIIGNDAEPFCDITKALATPTPYNHTTRLARAVFLTGIKLSQGGRVTVLTPSEIDLLGYEGGMLVSSRNPDRVAVDPVSQFRLDGEAIHSLTQRVLPEIAMYAITNMENWAGSGMERNPDHVIPDA